MRSVTGIIKPNYYKNSSCLSSTTKKIGFKFQGKIFLTQAREREKKNRKNELRQK